MNAAGPAGSRPPPGRVRITYRLACDAGEDPEDKARAIAYEQTVELPPQCVTGPGLDRFVGRLEELQSEGEGSWRATLSYDPAFVDDPPQLANLLFGNISLKSGILVAGLDLPPELLRRFGGPRLGIPGVRRLLGDGDVRRPLTCGVLKPVGLSPEGLADRARKLALGGLDMVKDDNGLTDQETARFRERVLRCQEAVDEANRGRGGHTIYLPNVTSGASELEERLAFVRAAGCTGVLVSPMLVGFDAVWRVAQKGDLVVLSHPSLAGALFGDRHGVSPAVLLGTVFRLLGSDAVIYPNAGGRFPWTEETCEAVNQALRGELDGVLPTFPVPAGGIDMARIRHWTRRYGPDTIFLVGGSLYVQPDLEIAARRLVEFVATVE